jgi:SAM-dependent methyltransferase
MHGIKQLAEKVIPRKYLRVVGLYVTRAMSIFMKGDRYECPICEFKGRRLLSYGLKTRSNILCPWCLSLERHRLLWLYLRQRTNIFDVPIKMLHFAPEHQVQEDLKNRKNIDYTSCDLDMPTAMIKVDITKIQFADNTFDVIICNHVLEHIPDDALAMRELYRVLKPNGWAILQTPMNIKQHETIEDLSPLTGKQREQMFGQNDHMREYGLDKKDRLKAAGFKVEVDGFVRTLPQETIDKYALEDIEDIYLCKK